MIEINNLNTVEGGPSYWIL